MSEDGNWDGCEFYLKCEYSHTLIEILYNPLHYKIKECLDKTTTNKFQCTKVGEFCCFSHSPEERKLTEKALESVPKVVLQSCGLPTVTEEIMQYYKEVLPDYDEARNKNVKKPEQKASIDKKPPRKVSLTESSDSEEEESKQKKTISAAEAETHLKEASQSQWQKLQSLFGNENKKEGQTSQSLFS